MGMSKLNHQGTTDLSPCLHLLPFWVPTFDPQPYLHVSGEAYPPHSLGGEAGGAGAHTPGHHGLGDAAILLGLSAWGVQLWVAFRGVVSVALGFFWGVQLWTLVTCFLQVRLLGRSVTKLEPLDFCRHWESFGT